MGLEKMLQQMTSHRDFNKSLTSAKLDINIEIPKHNKNHSLNLLTLDCDKMQQQTAFTEYDQYAEKENFQNCEMAQELALEIAGIGAKVDQHKIDMSMYNSRNNKIKDIEADIDQNSMMLNTQ